MIGPIYNQTLVVNLKTDSKMLYYSTLYTEIKIIDVYCSSSVLKHNKTKWNMHH